VSGRRSWRSTRPVAAARRRARRRHRHRDRRQPALSRPLKSGARDDADARRRRRAAAADAATALPLRRSNIRASATREQLVQRRRPRLWIPAAGTVHGGAHRSCPVQRGQLRTGPRGLPRGRSRSARAPAARLLAAQVVAVKADAEAELHLAELPRRDEPDHTLAASERASRSCSTRSMRSLGTLSSRRGVAIGSATSSGTGSEPTRRPAESQQLK
jgi:hypothetical protein